MHLTVLDRRRGLRLSRRLPPPGRHGQRGVRPGRIGRRPLGRNVRLGAVGRPEHSRLDLDHPDRWCPLGHRHGAAVHRRLGLVGPERFHVSGCRLGAVSAVGVLVRHG
ncbi:hypothetical protein GCM10009828_007070 [Actinoplanes couchii]|uniref:Uncharacterized protein n=1 Tax=Actinoplanes couchii TaxID=403638 RepID=A0ABQ3XJN7_9ACTN|nr:hypothetical protein Aco03nite_071180 [Actinoplanes couchii]